MRRFLTALILASCLVTTLPANYAQRAAHRSKSKPTAASVTAKRGVETIAANQMRDYLTFIARQDRAAGVAAWRGALAGLEEGTRLAPRSSGREPLAPEHIVLPVDAVTAGAFKAGVPTKIVDIAAVPADQMILDIGPQSAREVGDLMKSCKTLVWNGPLGAFETPPFDTATVAIAQSVAALTQ